MNKAYQIIMLSLVVGAVACGNDDGDASGSSGTSGNGAVEPAKMVQLPAGFWIDSTEVTRAQYQAWLATDPATDTQPPECSWNDDFTPGCDWPPGYEPNHPVVCVDWCDAYAYCKGVGKRLCGKIGGGTLSLDDRWDASKSQWLYACSSGGLYEYPYGNEYDPEACNLKDSGLESMASVASFEGCQSSVSGFEGVFDLCGSVEEWIDSCGSREGSDDGCHRGGGMFTFPGKGTDCTFGGTTKRNLTWGGLGFRCCRE